jgi:hypothetical protein
MFKAPFMFCADGGRPVVLSQDSEMWLWLCLTFARDVLNCPYAKWKTLQVKAVLGMHQKGLSLYREFLYKTDSLYTGSYKALNSKFSLRHLCCIYKGF